MKLSALQRFDADQLAGYEWLVGIDEAGRGALAGPVVAGACVLSKAFFESREAVKLSAAMNDSKQLTAETRETYFGQIESLRDKGLLDFTVASGSVETIAKRNILGATRWAMQQSVEALAARASAWGLEELAADGPLFAESTTVKMIVDGRPLKPFPYTHEGIIGGDGKSLAIAIASIVAKVTRDRELVRLASEHPGYGFERHKGYATLTHRTAILERGPSVIHRELFLRKILASARSG